MKKYFIGIVIFLLSINFSYSQLANQNTYLLRSLDSYQGYSACLGCTAPNGREYTLLGTSTGTSFIDITDSANIHEVDFVLTGFSNSNIIKPNYFSLDQNYPSPFNPTTYIKFSIKENSFVN